MAKSKSSGLIIAKPFNLNLPDGTQRKFQVGEKVVGELAEHWYVQAHATNANDEADAEAEAKAAAAKVEAEAKAAAEAAEAAEADAAAKAAAEGNQNEGSK